MSTLRRRLMMATEKSPIPSEYQLVEYIYNSGEARIDLVAGPDKVWQG